jgi:hypothetical protein
MGIGIMVINILILSLFAPIVRAIAPTTQDMIHNGVLFYDPGYKNCVDKKNINDPSTDGKVIDDTTIYDSGLDPDGPFILEQFAIHILKASAQKLDLPEEDLVTKQHVVALVAFAIGEGGDINNASVFNPWNLSYRSKDIIPIPWANNGAAGEQAYKSFNQGVEAYARQINMGYQSRLGKVLSKKDSTAAEFMHALTYYKEFKGNLAWAGASESDPDGYYRDRMVLVKQVKNNYEKQAGLVIGTQKEEQDEAMYKPSLLQFGDVKNDNVDDYTKSQYDEPCDEEDSGGGTASGNGWDLSGPNKMTFYRQRDPKWASYPFPCDRSPTIGGCGCWAVTSASIISTLSNKKINPKELVQKYGNAQWLIGPPTDYGLESRKIGTNGSDFDLVVKTLKSGGLVGMYSLTGTFTTVQHMMIIRKVSDDGKLFYVYDLHNPNSEVNQKGYTRQELKEEGNLQEMYIVTKKSDK